MQQETFEFNRKQNTEIGTLYINDELSTICIILHCSTDGQIKSHVEPYPVISEQKIQDILFSETPWYEQQIACCFPKMAAQNTYELFVIGDWNEKTHIVGTLNDFGNLMIVPTSTRQQQLAQQLRERN